MRMNTIQKLLPACLAALMPFAASAQDINSTVTVTKAYEGKLHEVHKPALQMQVPDSLTHFDLEFEYDSFRSRYTSSYEFHPHLLDLKPNAQIDKGNSFFMKIGAGYTLHPYLDLVWSPTLKHNWKLNLYASHHSYVGNYYKIGSYYDDPGKSNLLNLNKCTSTGHGPDKYFGHDLLSTAGVDTRHDWENSALMLDVDYYGLTQKDWMKARTYNAVDAKFRVFSKSLKPDRFHYDVRLDYRFAGDHADYTEGPRHLNEHNFSLNAVIGPVVKEDHKILFDMGVDGAAYTGAFNAFNGNIYIASKYIYEKGRWDIAAGVRFAKLIRNGERPMKSSAREQYVYPDVNISFTAIKNGMDIYLKAVGGNDINPYSSILSRHHFADFTFARGGELLNSNVDRINAALGLRGRITPYFSYDLQGGYQNHANAMMDRIVEEGGYILPAFGYTRYHNAFASMDLRFDTGVVSASVAARYNWSEFFGDAEGYFAPSAVEGLAEVNWNWRKRIYVGVDCEFATGRRAVMGDEIYRIKAWGDLGAYFEYKHTSRLSFWLRGGNLLFQTIQRNPMYAEKGGNFTLGICLNM